MSRIKPISDRQRERLRQYEKTKRAWWKTVKGQLCPVMLGIYGIKVKVDKHPHHRRGRLGYLLCDTRFWLAVSNQGHDWIHGNPHRARANGWLAGPGEWGKTEPDAPKYEHTKPTWVKISK